MAYWSFLTNHARVLLCIANDPGVRLRDIAAKLGITERSAYGIVTELTEDGYVSEGEGGHGWTAESLSDPSSSAAARNHQPGTVDWRDVGPLGRHGHLQVRTKSAAEQVIEIDWQLSSDPLSWLAF